MFYLVCIFIFVFCKSLCFILSVFLYWFYLYDFLYFVCICIWIYICICIYMYIVCFCELVFLFLCICAGGCHSLPNWVNWVNSNFNYRRHYLCCQCILRPSLGAAIAGGGVGAGVSAKLSYVFIGVNALAFPYQIAHEYFHGKHVWQLWILKVGEWNKCRPQTNLSGSLRWP